ncbi:GntR family transcriptional regulator [Chryseobacterium sp. T16E-39]|uniref:aminotransferase-like domain-containing protein n=1 Tax=Chryseobacterium sp. T16E-39 TaxID=2015076 RepID=UPI000B5B164F|nr:PLP-dependent aminotransferase family protein [Chryseobacterium sp. T16E-39]ASK29257.1 GntR family transcriptional regulator [Chryseobacterium sp. T16E-39]
MKKEILYLKIAGIIEKQILNGTLRLGDKIPSIRTVQKVYNVSINTVRQAFLELESKSLIEPKPKSGYYVSKASQRKFSLPSVIILESLQKEQHPEDLFHKTFASSENQDITHFSMGLPEKSLLPIAQLNKSVTTVMRSLANGGVTYESVQGNINFRRTVARWAFMLEGKITEDDVIVTSGGMNGMFTCLMAVTKPGDKVAIESPAYFGIIKMLNAMGLEAVEIPSDPSTGLDLEALKKVLPTISACCFIVNFNNPLGTLMPDTHKKELVRMLTEWDIPLVENDMFRNVYYGAERPKPCKAFDESGIVMLVNSVSKTLAPGYRIGWIIPGKYKDKIIQQKLIQTISTPALYQEALSHFLENGRYDHHLRTFRKTIHQNCLKLLKGIEDYFPENTKVSQPEGGFMLWVELDKKIDTVQLFDISIRQNITFAPGRMFTQYNQYNNCMRLNFAMDWNDKVNNDLKTLGKIITKW